MRETRTGKLTELREDAEDGRKYFTARVCNYGVPDSYNTSWQQGVFRESLERELPTAVFAHQWDRPIGKVVSYEDHADGLDVTVRMSDLDANPDAKRMYHHLKDGEINQFSFAFERQNEERDAGHDGVTRITRATLDEVSPVLKGSVPGTRVLSMRAGESIPKQVAVDLIIKLSTGDIDLADALMTLKTGDTGEGAPMPTLDPDKQTEGDTDAEPKETPAEPQTDPDEEAILEKLDELVLRSYDNG